MNCNLRVQGGPEIKGEVTSPSWENREKFAATREKCFLTEDTPQKHDYIISSYKPSADLFSLYFNNLFNTDFIFVLQGSQIRRALKKSKKNYVFTKI